ncbi:MAG: hypothetical protein NTX63_00410 [Candidatus Peregrinibacteria bacterium]|nr:hypothetical protein [Candidatus Peregrinibacteria bacterium]
MSLIPTPAQAKILIWEAFQEIEKRDREMQPKSKIIPAQSTTHLAIAEVMTASKDGDIDVIPPDDEGRLVYLMGTIRGLSSTDGRKLVRLCRLLKSQGRTMSEEDFTTTMTRSLRASDIVGIAKIAELIELILPGKNPQTMVEDVYTLIRTSSKGAINVINPHENAREASCLLAEDIPNEHQRPLIIRLSGSSTVELSREGKLLSVKSFEVVEGGVTTRIITKKVPLMEDGSITIGRDMKLHDPLGLKTRTVILCSWGIVDQSVSRAALNIQIESGRIYIFDLHSANGATIE